MGNSRDLPTYNKSVGLEVTAQPDPEGSASMMINAFRNFSESVASVSQGISNDQAKQQRDIIKNNISNTYRGFALEALKNPDQTAALNNYNEASKQYAQGLHAQTDTYNKAYVSNLIDYYHNEHSYTIQKNAITQNQRVLSVDAYKRMNDATIDWQDAINNSKPMVDEKGEDVQFNSARALFADQLRNMETDAKNKALDPAVMGKGRAELIKKYVTAEYIKRYEDHVQQGQGNAFITKVRDTQFHIPGLSDEDKFQVVGQMIKIRDQGIRGANVAIGQLQYDRRDDVKNVSNGGMPNADLQVQLDSLNPIVAQEHKNNVEIAQQSYAAKEAALYKTPEEKANMKADFLNIDYNAPDSAKKRRIADAAIKAIDQQDKEMQADPLKFVMKQPAIQNAVNNYEQAYNANAVGEDHRYTPFNSTVPKPWQSIIQEQMNLGFTLNGKGGNSSGQGGNSVRLLNPDKVPGMVSEVMAAQPVDKLIYMNKLNDEYGGGLPFKLVLKQLINAGLPRNYGLMATIDPNSPDAQHVANALSMPAAEIYKDLKTRDEKQASFISKTVVNHVFSNGVSGTSNFKAFMSTLPKYGNANDVAFRDDMSSSIQQIANYFALTQSMQGQQAVDKAENIIADRYSYMSMNGSALRLPHDVSDTAVRQYATKMQIKVMHYPFNYDGVNQAKAETLISHGHWKNDTVDNGLLWVDANGKMWTDKNGHPYAFSFDDAVHGGETPISTTAQLQHPDTQQQIDTGDEQDKAIAKAGASAIQRGKAAGKKFHSLMQNINQGAQ